MEHINVAVIGIGNMGSAHAACIAEDKINGMSLTAVCDISEKSLKSFRKNIRILSTIQATKNYWVIKSATA